MKKAIGGNMVSPKEKQLLMLIASVLFHRDEAPRDNPHIENALREALEYPTDAELLEMIRTQRTRRELAGLL